MEVAEVLPEFADAFAFEEFNRMQREALPALLESEENVVASAPTASGKTALAELAICKTLSEGGTALFIAPLRALTNEKEDDWDRFEDLGYSVYVVTGERDLNPRRARRADILVMTPEKLDSATRKHDSRRYDFVTEIDVCVIDEVHLLDADRRGSVLEVTISRLRRLCNPRVVALSATMPNVDDVAAWLDAPAETTFEFGEEYRPVDLHAGVKTYTHGENSFADKYRRLYRALDIAEPHLREDGQALVFVSSRQDTVRAAEKARDEIAERDIEMGVRGDYDFHTELKETLENDTLRKSVLDGVAFHHAGLSKDERDLVEEWFKEGRIELLFSTSTLAWGVNLPARCVVIRDTKLHDPLEGEVDMSPLDVLQMLGRAGRPGYDDVGYGWVVCDRSEADKYRRLLDDGKEIESRLAESLETHLNAEIAMGTIADVEEVMAWLETTFYYERGQSKPEEYGFPDLRRRVRDCLEDLVDRGFVEMDGDDLSIEATPRGRLASKYYLRLETAATFADLCDRVAEGTVDLGIDEIFEAVATADEFDSVSARQSEQDAIDTVLADRETSDLEAGQRKVLAVLESSTGSTPTELTDDAWVIRRNATRLVSALGAFLDRLVGPHAANLARRAEAQLEHGVSETAVGLTAIDDVASGRASKLSKEGLTTPGDVLEAGIVGLVDAGLSEGVAERVYEGAQSLPAVEIDWGPFPETIATGENEVCEVTIRNVGEPARAGIRVTVTGRGGDASSSHSGSSVPDDGVEMTSTSSYLRDTETVPVGVFGADADELEFTVSVAFPEEPLVPIQERRLVDVV
ncbi:DEAD/DEAH box helicase [Natronolimnohabitans sp. A-GB9]|uniref:DEAD/DEAH box helicase n=1 Tax=Natronolimnohabitans sp. A-GB9 TaxID=3069757 RepID=UPI0027B78CCA|nr:DEAD/DEAH box helicase [Natronolimnohabitans sp. A-GB9]MDQ2050440.1 DEAD/DEAH box helicase [Natronolimnohabitans sp. A-GB9]